MKAAFGPTAIDVVIGMKRIASSAFACRRKITRVREMRHQFATKLMGVVTERKKLLR